jgi:hypothetical protein
MGTIGGCLASCGIPDGFHGSAGVVGDECCRDDEEEYG